MADLGLHIFELFDRAAENRADVVYSDDNFTRRQIDSEVMGSASVRLICDTVVNESMQCLYVSVYADEQFELRLDFDGLKLDKHDTGYVGTSEKQNNTLFWLPKEPVCRTYDEHGRIVTAEQRQFTVAEDQELSLKVLCKCKKRTEFCILWFSTDADRISNELVVRDLFEDARVTKISPRVFEYRRMDDFWKYMINAAVYKPGHDDDKPSVRSEHTAFSLYFYCKYLYDRSGKRIYSIIRDMIGYCVLLGQQEDGRFVNGCWSELMETHTVFVVSGAFVLIDCFERTGSKVFAEKAAAAADYLVNNADRFSDETEWFLHDSLELNAEDVRKYYDPMIKSNAFGKSASNTLCLNSHLYTLTLLDRLSRFDGYDKYNEHAIEGLRAFRMVCGQKPASFAYSAIYGARDFFAALSVKLPLKATARLAEKYDSFLRKGFLLKFKNNHPRLLMPNGYTERDLTHTVITDDYHLINLRDMLKVYANRRERPLGEIVERTMRYTMKSSIVDRYGKYNRKATIVLETLILYTGYFGDKYLARFGKFAGLINPERFGANVDLISNPHTTPGWVGLGVNNENVAVFSIPARDDLAAVIVNTCDTEQTFDVQCEKGEFKNYYSATDISGNIVPSGRTWRISGKGVIKISKNKNL